MITPQQMGMCGWTAVRALPYLNASAKDQLREAVKTYMVDLDKQLDATPFGVPPSLGTWGGSGAVIDMAIRMYFLHKSFPYLVGPEYTVRAVNYILGTHPVSSTSYVAGVGTISRTKTYSNNRADNAYIPGAVIPGYIIIKPDFRSVSTTSEFSGSRMKPWWPDRRAGWWPATPQTRLLRNRSSASSSAGATRGGELPRDSSRFNPIAAI